MADNLSIDDRTCATFETPDGDIFQLTTWSFIIDRLQQNLTPTLEQLTLINTALTAIDTKLDDWIPDE